MWQAKASERAVANERKALEQRVERLQKVNKCAFYILDSFEYSWQRYQPWTVIGSTETEWLHFCHKDHQTDVDLPSKAHRAARGSPCQLMP